MSRYQGLTYPRLLDNKLAHYLWRRLFCSRQWHLFDESLGVNHTLHCDACGYCVYIEDQK